MSNRLRITAAITILTCLAGAASARAQAVEVTPFGGYRFGGDFYELMAGQRIDRDGAPALGIVLDFPTAPDFQVEAMYSHQDASVPVLLPPFRTATPVRMSVDHWQAGGLQEFSDGRSRPFLTGMFGLTRYAAEGDSEIRFTLGAGGGVKLLATPRIGVRLDGRVFATFADASGSGFACGPGGCLLALHVNVVWQAEFTAGVVIRFPMAGF